MASFESKFKREISRTVDAEQSVTVAGKPMILSPANSHDSIAATSDNSSGMTLKLPPFVVCMETSYLDIEKKMEELTISKYSAGEKPMILSPTNSHASIAVTSDSTSIVATSNDTSIAATSDGTFVATTTDNSSGMTLKLPPFVACMEIFDLYIEKKMEELTIAKHLQAIVDSQQQLEKIAERVRLLGPCPINNCPQHSQSTEIDHNSSEDLIFPSKRLTVKSESTICLDRPESPIETSNSFQELEKAEENIEMIPELPTPKFHPIMVWSANLGIQFLKEISKAFNNDLEISVSGDYFKIFPTDPDHHKKICQYLSNSKINFFLNTPKHLRVVIKGLHVSTSNSEIEEELTNLGFEIKSVTQLTDRKHKQPLSIWQVVLPKTKKNLDILKIDRLMYLTIKVERFNRKPLAMQCFRCNFFHHRANNCNLEPRCLKCGKGHTHKECSIQGKLEKPICINCSGTGHAASWRGCPKFPSEIHFNNARNICTKNYRQIDSTFSYSTAVKNPSLIPPMEFKKNDTPTFGDFFKALFIMKELISIFSTVEGQEALANKLKAIQSKTDKLYNFINGMTINSK